MAPGADGSAFPAQPQQQAAAIYQMYSQMPAAAAAAANPYAQYIQYDVMPHAATAAASGHQPAAFLDAHGNPINLGTYGYYRPPPRPNALTHNPSYPYIMCSFLLGHSVTRLLWIQ